MCLTGNPDANSGSEDAKQTLRPSSEPQIVVT